MRAIDPDVDRLGRLRPRPRQDRPDRHFQRFQQRRPSRRRHNARRPQQDHKPEAANECLHRRNQFSQWTIENCKSDGNQHSFFNSQFSICNPPFSLLAPLNQIRRDQFSSNRCPPPARLVSLRSSLCQPARPHAGANAPGSPLSYRPAHALP